MDISAFSSDEHFDEIEWVNSLFRGVSSKDKNFKRTVEDNVSKLQLYVQQANTAIESTTSSIISNFPSIAHDSKIFLEQAKELKTKMIALEKEICKSEISIANLERLDDLKMRLEAAKTFLEQNDSFSKLTQELDDLLESENKDVNQACEKLAALQKSYEAQMGLAGQSERELVLEDFKNRFEASITSEVVKSLQSQNIQESIRYVEIFNKIDRLPQIVNYYGTLQRNIYESKWNEIVVENQENHRFLGDFYDFLCSSWSRQLKWYREVFKTDGKSETVQIFIDLFGSIQPSRETVISGHLKRSADKMEFLEDISAANEKFRDDLVEKIESELPEKLNSAIFDFFNLFIVQYSSIEQSHLTSQLDEFKVLQTNSADTIRYLESAASKVFELAYQAVGRQSKITQDCAIVSLVYILNTFFKSFLEKVKKGQLQLDASRGERQDWNLLQLSINFLSIIGSFKMKIDEIEAHIKTIWLNKMKETGCRGYKIVGQRDISDFEKISARLINNEFPVIFESISSPIENLSKETHQTILRIIFSPIENFFQQLQISEAADSSIDLPDYSFTPNLYITEVGQFLLTLPQNLEPLLLNPAKPLKLALEISDSTYKDNIPSADILLSLIAFETCVLYEEKVKEILVISNAASKQLATDIDYLASVLEELGLTISTVLKTMAFLLKIKPENYSTESAGTDAKLSARIRQMRNIQVIDEM